MKEGHNISNFMIFCQVVRKLETVAIAYTDRMTDKPVLRWIRRLGTSLAHALAVETVPLHYTTSLRCAEGMMTLLISRCTFRRYLLSFRFLHRKCSEARVKHTCLCVAGHLTATTCRHGATWPSSHSVVTDCFCMLYLSMQCNFRGF